VAIAWRRVAAAARACLSLGQPALRATPAFGLDNGATWAAVLRDLGPTIAPPPRSVR